MKIQEEFTKGQSYSFTKNGRLTTGEFDCEVGDKLVFKSKNGRDIYLNKWDARNVTPVKDNELKEKFVKVPNQHGFVESALREGIYGYQTFTSTGERGKPVYTFTYASRDKIAKYDKGNYTLTLYKEWVNHIKSLIEWLNEYYPGFFIRQSSPDDASFSRFNPTEEEAVQYIKDQIRRGKVFTESKINESSYKSGDKYYGGLPSDSDYKGPGKDATYYKELVKYFRDTVEKYPEYKVIGASPVVLILKTPDGKETIDLRKFDSCSSSEEAIEMASHYFDDSLFEANELEKRAKKHKKKQKGLPMNGLNPNAGNVEINNKVFNTMNNVNSSPSTNPTGPMGEEMTRLEAMSCLNRLNEEDLNERDFAIYCDNAFGKYKVANWKAADAETAVAEFKELNPKYTKTGLITAVEI